MSKAKVHNMFSVLSTVLMAGLFATATPTAVAEPVGEPRVIRTEAPDACKQRRETGASVRRESHQTVYSTQAPPLSGCEDDPANPRNKLNRSEYPIVVIELEPEAEREYGTEE